jgi:hypothetical protein
VTDSTREARSLATAVADLIATTVTRTINILNKLIDGLQGFHLTEQAIQMQGSVVGALDNLSAGRLCPASSKIRVASWQPDFCDLDLMHKKDPMDHENNAIICCPA